MTGSQPPEDKEEENSRKESNECRGSGTDGAACILGTIKRPQPGLDRAVEGTVMGGDFQGMGKSRSHVALQVMVGVWGLF